MEERKLSEKKRVIQERIDIYAMQRIQNNDGWWLPSSKPTTEIIRRLNYKFARGKVLDYLAKRIPENGLVLDVGGGTGIYSNKLHQLRPDLKIFSFDISKALQQHGEHLYGNKNLVFVNGDVEDVSSFDKGVFDAIFSLEALEHFEDWQGALKNLHEWGKRGCQYYITTPNGASIFDQTPNFINAIYKNKYEKTEGDIYDSPVNTDKLKYVLINYGFDGITIKYSQAFCEWPAKACAKIFGVPFAYAIFSFLECIPVGRRWLCFTQMLSFGK